MKPLASQALEVVGKNWGVSKGTREAKLQTMGRFAEFVQHTFGLERVENLKPKHVQAYAASLHEQGVSARTGRCGGARDGEPAAERPGTGRRGDGLARADLERA